MTRAVAILLLSGMITACGSKTPSTEDRIRLAVQQTIAAIPAATLPPAPPEATALPLQGIFCEYQFCIGHPSDMAFYDVIAKQNPSAPAASKFDDGILAAHNDTVFILVMWQTAPAGSDPQFMLDLILDGRVDSRTAGVEIILVRDLDVFYVPIATSATALLPYGGGAAWRCAERAFAWKAYTTRPDLARNLLMQALQPFRCEG